jgi:hypothetical protein
MSIFGISIFDNFDFLPNFINQFRLFIGAIAGYLTVTPFYGYLSGLFSGLKLTKEP